ncbi:PadR family transcriptional regulator [Nocardia sp. NBC_01329]|uniref:PadR family transcriptional regulator n=1 Tax=Nocardia sp. NBC_01329 TaxID=2903594 RepID=UPI002E1338A3|nr:PadR family transcriptional regulator [Nocardia sp. NBC_01329]
MALKFAILTALTERECSGFELARRFDRLYGFFWSASHQQIYRELERLRTTGWITEVPLPGRSERGQPKRFTITESGTTALHEWTGEIDEPTHSRESLMVKTRAAASGGDLDGLRAVIEHHLAVHNGNLGEHTEVQNRDFASIGTDADALRHLVLKAGIAMEQFWVDWCREALDTLHAIQARPATEPKPQFHD